MTLANVLKDRVGIQVKTTTATSLGQTEVWSPVEIRNCRVIPLDAKARLAYQQLKSEVTHKVVFRGTITLTLGDNRLLWKDKTLEPVEPVQELDNESVVLVKEI